MFEVVLSYFVCVLAGGVAGDMAWEGRLLCHSDARRRENGSSHSSAVQATFTGNDTERHL